MSERLSCGQARLDQILEGGLPANSINLIIGTPGAGKTILAEQYVFRNATRERPALYLSTVSEPFDKLLRFGQTLDFFDAKAVGARVRFEDLGMLVAERGLEGVIARIDELLREFHPRFLVIDSFKALRAFAKNDADYRRFLHDLAGRLTALAITSFWVGEYDLSSAVEAAEFAVADAIIALSIQRKAQRQLRVLEILKLRGSDFSSGQHAYRITSSGLDVFPRLADRFDATSYRLEDDRLSTGVAALDELLADGYWRGSTTLVSGPSGIGKTLMGLHFIYAGARRGERGIVATLQENPTQLARMVQGFGWSVEDPAVTLMARSPVAIQIDEWVYELLDLVSSSGAKRVLIDSLVDLEATAEDPVRFREWMYSLTSRFSRAGVSLFMTYEVSELFHFAPVGRSGMSHLADNVILLHYVPVDSRMDRALTVLKTRATRHEPVVRSFQISSEGIVLGSRLEALAPSV